VTGEPAGLAWPSSPPPPAADGWHWDLTSVAELPRVRAQLRRGLAAESNGSPAAESNGSPAAESNGSPAAESNGSPAAGSSGAPTAEELDEAVVLAFDEMASNALRHGGGGVRARVQRTPRAWLIEVRDSAPHTPPQPAVGRDPSQGGLGLYLIAEMADAHGWHLADGQKSVWALLPRR
jgi:anti-sigma regulatory factor (Ser/Thr protein kinase)